MHLAVFAADIDQSSQLVEQQNMTVIETHARRFARRQRQMGQDLSRTATSQPAIERIVVLRDRCAPAGALRLVPPRARRRSPATRA